MQPDKIKLLTPAEIEALPAPPEAADAQPLAAAPVQYGCYEWGSFSTASLPRARNILAKFSLNSAVKQKTSQEATRWWVYIPRQQSLQTAQAKVEELRKLGVQESFVILELQWRYAISLGVFKDEQLATKLLDELKARGVVSAVKGMRNQESGRASLLIDQMSSVMASEIDKLKPDFPGSELKQVTCQ
ncbi:MAG: hypothetical protein ABI475_11440 [Methylophilaceae bacterium]